MLARVLPQCLDVPYRRSSFFWWCNENTTDKRHVHNFTEWNLKPINNKLFLANEQHILLSHDTDEHYRIKFIHRPCINVQYNIIVASRWKRCKRDREREREGRIAAGCICWLGNLSRKNIGKKHHLLIHQLHQTEQREQIWTDFQYYKIVPNSVKWKVSKYGSFVVRLLVHS